MLSDRSLSVVISASPAVGGTARRLDGAAVAEAIRESLRPRIDAVRRAAGRSPALGLLLAGDDPGSAIYVRNKVAASETLGMATDLRTLPTSASFDEALAIVDGFNRPALAPCTPSGVIALLDRCGIEIAGRRAVVLGRSDIVGKPMAMLLLHRHATVTICHSRTAHLPRVASEADILVAAIGRPAFVTAEFVKPGATVIDVGTNALTDRDQVVAIFGEESRKLDAFDRRGHVLSGDIHPDVANVAGALTPVPGGVGPLTIAMLLSNTVRAAEAHHGL